MSKRVGVEFTCPECGHSFHTELFRTIWVEEPELRQLVFEDRINIVECENCQAPTRVPYGLMATNVKRHFAVWYEPYPDQNIDADAADYRAVFGPHNFYSDAPRVKDWEEFKETILKFERGELEGTRPERLDFAAFSNIAQQQSQSPRPKSLLARLFGKR